MCQCTPEIKTPYCGKPGCEWPGQKEANVVRVIPQPDEHQQILEAVRRVENLLLTIREVRDFREAQLWGGPPLVVQQYTCARCNFTFGSYWMHASARTEYEREFSEQERKYGTPKYVCDRCYERIQASRPKHHLVPEDTLKL